ncbi:MAG: type II secretion system protein [Thermodesulfobacteriota bacterium]|nr:type II secretion system protein [Thermodesulfobacteriota bacterium]
MDKNYKNSRKTGPKRFISVNGLDKGFTLIEMIIVMAILSLMATIVMPLAKTTSKRNREMELRQNLRIIRTALDEYKKLADEGKIYKGTGESGYPKNMQILIDGVPLINGGGMKAKLLRRIPEDPMTEDGEWGKRSYFDDPDTEVWDGRDIYDVYSKSNGIALDGSRYGDW